MCDFAMQLHAQPHGVESALPHVANISLQLVKAHLLRRAGFFLEILRTFHNFRKRTHFKCLIVSDHISTKIALPAMFKNPAMNLRVPMRSGRKNTPRQRKSRWIEFEDSDVGETVV